MSPPPSLPLRDDYVRPGFDGAHRVLHSRNHVHHVDPALVRLREDSTPIAR
jgi:hypothetical protein